MDFDLIVIGAGSGGLAAAKRAAKHGAKVALIEGDLVGGTCVIRGCVPKKLLVYGSIFRDNLNKASNFGLELRNIHFDQSVLLENVRQEVIRLNNLHVQFLQKAGVQLFRGWGSFIDEHSVVVKSSENKVLAVLKAENVLIAVGGRPRIPDIPGNELGWVSDDMFIQKKFPEKVTIVGAGFIACEFACILNALGVEVVQLIRGTRLLRGFDLEVVSILEKNMKDKGIHLMFGDQPIGITSKGNGLLISTSQGSDFETGAILFAIGRKPFLNGLNVDNAGLKVKEEKIIVDDMNRTNISNIFAVGDVTDRINLTPVAVDEGRALSDSLFGVKSRKVSYELVPSAVFSQPEIASVGMTEHEALDLYGKGNIKIYRSEFKAMSQAIPKTNEKCLLKLVVLSEDERIIGCHMAGEHSSEIIQMATIALRMGATKVDFDQTMALHPTVAEEFVTMI